jgi:hypothetical protein
MRELTAEEIALVSGGDSMTYSWGTYVGGSIGAAWRAWAYYAASPEASTTVIP